MAGFINDVMNADNVNFGTALNGAAEVTADAQLLIGNAIFPNIRTGTLTSTGGTVTISYVAPNINLETGAAIASSYPVDNGGPGIPAAGMLSLLGATSTDFPNPSGIETHVGATTNEIYFENRRFVSSLIVDPSATVGLRGTFQTITAALAAAVAGQTVFVRPGTYTENVVLVDSVPVVGLTTSGSAGVPSAGGTAGQVFVDGLMTVPAAGGSTSIQNLQLTDGGNVTTLLADGMGGTLTVFNCSITNAGGFAIRLVDSNVTINQCTISSPGGSAIQFDTGAGVCRIFDTRIDSSSYCVELNSSASFFADTCILVSSGAGTLIDNVGGNIEISRSQLISTAAPSIDMQVGGTCVLSYNVLSSPNQCISFNAAGPLVRSYQNSYIVGAGSEYVVGPGTYEYGSDVVNPLSASGIDGAATQVKFGWRPWAEAGVGPAPSATTIRGTAAFDSAQFTVTDGWVQATGNMMTWTDQGAPTTVLPQSGSFATAAIALTMPAFPVQGDEVCFKTTSAAALAVTANAGQTLQLGNQISAVAGTCTSTDTGDAICFTYRAASARWIANSSIGSWVVV